ncbi:MAG: VWA domain-containing protein [Planctomycetaceae bacterium]|nr:VWA domain-containing protein [Planctomycetaceae bacterium]
MTGYRLRNGVVVLSLLWAQALLAQGVLISRHPFPLPRPHIPPPVEANYKISQLSIEGRVDDQVADIQVSQTFENCGRGTIEAQFVFPLPYDGAIDELTLLVDGKELTGKLLSREDARKRYEAIVRSQRDPALLEWIGTGMFQTSVFPIPAGESRTVSLHYTQLLRKDHTLTEFLFPLSTAKYTSKPLESINVRLSLTSNSSLKNIYSPTHAIDIKRNGKRRAVVTYSQKNTIPTSDFRLFFDAREGKVSTSLLSYQSSQSKDDGYFLLLASPDIQTDQEEYIAKSVLFVVDKSGSMSGKKIEQAREALKFVLNNLRDGDLFNIVAYDSKVETFRDELERFSKKSREEALGYVDGLYAGGGTNIHDALTRSFDMLQDKHQPTYVLFLTDGKPTNGQTNEAAIATAAKQANNVHARLMSFGVGYDVNSRLLDRLSREGFGLSEYVTPDEDIEEHVARVYNRISAPVLTRASLTFELDESQKKPFVNRLYPAAEFDLFAGEQLVLVGRYRKSGPVQIRLTGHVGEEKQEFTFQGDLTDRRDDHGHAFVAKLWATRRIGELIDELDLHGQNQELVDELVTLSTQYGILTPYTSFLADETVTPSLALESKALQSNSALARGRLTELDAESGQSAFQQRQAKQMFRNAAQAPSGSSSLPPLATPASAAGGVAGPGQPQTAPATDHPDESAVVRNSGVQTLYKRGQLVVTPETAEVDPERDKAQIQEIERYTDAYFTLIAANSAAENELLSQQRDDEQLLVKLRGQVYLIK